MADRYLLDSKCLCPRLIAHCSSLFYTTIPSVLLAAPILHFPDLNNLPYRCPTLYPSLHIIALQYISYATPPYPQLPYRTHSRHTLHNQTTAYLLLCLPHFNL